jgi:hypothetical protein
MQTVYFFAVRVLHSFAGQAFPDPEYKTSKKLFT